MEPIQTSQNFFKRNSTIILIVVGIGLVWWTYDYLIINKKCQKQVTYVPARGATEGLFNGGGGIFGPQPSEGPHFSWGSEKYESQEAAVRDCVRFKRAR